MKKKIILFAFLYILMASIPMTVTATQKASISHINKSDYSSETVQTATPYKEEKIEKIDLKNYTDYTEFKIYDTSSDKIVTVSNSEFLIGGTAAEVPSNFNTEAIKAQMLAAYTYYSRQRLHNRKGDNLEYDFKADLSLGEKYVTEELLKERCGDNYENVYSVYEKASKEVAKKIIAYEGEVALSVYYAISSGTTEKSENVFVESIPYLTAVASPYDTVAPGYKTEVSLTKDEVRAVISEKFPNTVLGDNPVDWFETTKRSESNTVLEIIIGTEKYTGLEVRSAFNLRSADFDIVYTEDNFVFSVRGYGHNVGMSQYGAEYMAQQGATYKEILQHYYPGTSIVEL